MATMSRDEIFKKVRVAVVEALSVEEGDVTETATLKGDLNAESIDILDIQFRLEKAFNIKMTQEDLAPNDIINNPDFVRDNKLNNSGLTALRNHFREGKFDEFEQNPATDRIIEVLTVGTIVSFIERKLAA
jgi:acyl carrier protein